MPSVSSSEHAGQPRETGTVDVAVALSPFAHSELQKEAERQNVPLEELLAYAGVYFLADISAGRAGRRGQVPRTDDAASFERNPPAA